MANGRTFAASPDAATAVPATDRTGTVTSPADTPAEAHAEQHVVVLSGLSGAGKTAATKLFEDLGYTCVDNLPGEMLPDLAALVTGDPRRFAKVAVVLDVRSGDAALAFAAMRGALEGHGIRPQVFFLEARDEVLIRRFSETRHRHPLDDQRGIASSIAEERRLLDPVRNQADVILDTSDLSLRELRERIFTSLSAQPEPDQLAIQLISFGFKFGVPLEADLVFDVRFMQNPYYVEELRPLSGRTEPVREFVLAQPPARRFLDFIDEYLDFAIPAYVAEGKTRLTIAIGCTGGFHRSIVIAEEIARALQGRDFGPVSVFHRELEPRVNLRRWLTPGIGIKRWLIVVFIGELGVALAGAFVFRQLAGSGEPDGPVQAVLYVGTLQFLPGIPRAVILAIMGIGLFAVGSVRVIDALMSPFRSGDQEQPLVEVIYQKRFLARGPKIVAIGGGTGLSTLLRGLKEHTSNLTAIVTVADDGGSSGKLREQFGVPPVGDIRNCIVALADAEPLMGRLLQYRFPGDATESLAGHAVGNLLIAAMTAVEGGDFEEAVRQVNRVLAVRGQVLPVSPTPLVLHAKLRDGGEVHGQSAIAGTTGIERVWLTPPDVRASEDALRAIAEADLIVIGPGSLYTSILPSLLLPEIRDAIVASPALRVYVCNVATQRGETEGFDLAEHVEALEAHTAPGMVDVVLANNQFAARAPSSWGAQSVRLRWPPIGGSTPRLVLDDVVDPDNAHHHDPERLAAAVLRVAEREGRARRRTPAVRSA